MDARPRVLSTALAFALALALAAPAAAQPMDTYGLGSRSIAMGGAVSADVEDFSANYYNPAGLIRSDYVRISAGWMGTHHDLQIGGFDSHVDSVRGLVGGLIVPGNIEGFRFAFGVAVHLNDERVSRTRSLPRGRPRWEFYDNRPHRTFLATHVAIRPVDWLLVGGGIAFLSYARNTLGARGVIDVASPETGTRLEHEVSADLTTIRYPQVGIQVVPIPELSFGLTYRGQFALDNTLAAEVMADLRIGPMTIPAYFNLISQSVNAFVPQQLSLGGSWAITPDFRVDAEVTWVNWSAYVSPIGTSTIVLDIDVPPALAGTIRVPGTITGSTPIAANFEDRFVPRLGVEGWAFRNTDLEVAVRGGFFYEASPVPNQSGIANLVDTDRVAFSAGAGLRLINLRPLLDGFLSFDLHLQYAHLVERTFLKASPVDASGDYRAGGDTFGGGLTMELGFR